MQCSHLDYAQSCCHVRSALSFLRALGSLIEQRPLIQAVAPTQASLTIETLNLGYEANLIVGDLEKARTRSKFANDDRRYTARTPLVGDLTDFHFALLSSILPQQQEIFSNADPERE